MATRIEKEMLKLAKDLTGGYKSEFMVLRPLVLDREGPTRISLSNLRKILSHGYKAMDGVYSWDKNGTDWTLEVFFENKDINVLVSHKFLGFSVGYQGEGSRGLMEAGKMMGFSFDPEKIFGGGLPESGKVRMKHLT